jgi:hypothetical protein
VDVGRPASLPGPPAKFSLMGACSGPQVGFRRKTCQARWASTDFPAKPATACLARKHLRTPGSSSSHPAHVHRLHGGGGDAAPSLSSLSSVRDPRRHPAATHHRCRAPRKRKRGNCRPPGCNQVPVATKEVGGAPILPYLRCGSALTTALPGGRAAPARRELSICTIFPLCPSIP